MSRKLITFYKKLFDAFGSQCWWPGETQFEIIVGAILTQNTNWGNVEKALNNLKAQKYLSPEVFQEISTQELAFFIKPAGYFNVKAKRLKSFISFLFERYDGSLDKMAREDLSVLRKGLLSVNGIGPETADSILLYAFNKPIFVVDAYTKRMLVRHRMMDQESDYHYIQEFFMDSLERDVSVFNEYHALIVRLGKEFCRTKALCEKCPLKFDLSV